LLDFYKKNKGLIDSYNKSVELYPEAYADMDYKTGINTFAGLMDKQNTSASKLITFGNDEALRGNISNAIIENKVFESAYALNDKTNKYEPIDRNSSKKFTSIDIPGKNDSNTDIADYNVMGLNTKDFSLELEHKTKGKKLHVYPTYRTAELGAISKKTLEKVNSNEAIVNTEFNDVYGLDNICDEIALVAVVNNGPNMLAVGEYWLPSFP